MNIRQQKVINELVANGGSVAHAMRKAGYSKNTARTPKKVTGTKAFKDIVNPVVSLMEKERIEILKRLPKMRSKAKYRDLMDGLDKTTKNIQLLGGKPTEIFDLMPEEKAQVDKALANL